LGHEFPPEAILAFVLTKLKQDAEEQIGEVRRVVITVPAYFDEVRRKATQDAGYIAGLEVLDIINEPTAAAITFGYHKGILGSGEQAEQRILVYDLGGGTFDVTVMEIKGTEFTALATDGDVLLGGQDWDQRVLDYVAEEFIRTHQLDPRDDPSTMGRLWRECEDAKRILSARAKVSVECEYQGRAIRCELTREDFEEMTRDLLDRTEFTTRQTLQASGLTWDDIDRVLLVGGSTRMPMVMDMLSKLSGKRPDRSVSADEAVAHGAALRAKQLLDKAGGAPPAFQIHNVNSHSLGVAATDRHTARRRTAVLIPRNTPLPVAAKRAFKTQRAGQKSILVEIVEGENASPDECCQVGQCAVRDLPPDLPAHTPVNVRFRYLENGRLTVMVNVGGTDTQLKHEITRENSLTPEQLDGWRQYVSAVTGEDEDGPEPESAQPEQRDQQAAEDHPAAEDEAQAAAGPTQAAGSQSAEVAEARAAEKERSTVGDSDARPASAKPKRPVRRKAPKPIPKSTTKSSISKSAATKSAAPKPAAPEPSTPKSPATKSSIRKSPVPKSSASKSAVSKSSISKSPAPKSSASKSSPPQSPAPEPPAPEPSAPESSASQSSAPELSPEASVDDPGPPEVEAPSPAVRLPARPLKKPPRPKSAAQPEPKSDATPPTETDTTKTKKAPSAAPPKSRPAPKPKPPAAAPPPKRAAPASDPTTQTVASEDTPASSAPTAMSTVRDKFRFRRRSKSPQDIEEAKCAILERLANGEISAEAAAEAIERL
jgi:molecular chaperone DnaK